MAFGLGVEYEYGSRGRGGRPGFGHGYERSGDHEEHQRLLPPGRTRVRCCAAHDGGCDLLPAGRPVDPGLLGSRHDVLDDLGLHDR